MQSRRRFASRVQTGLRDVDGVSLIGDAPGCSGSYWFLMLRFDTSKLGCDSQEFAAALLEEGIGGVYGGYPFFPTDQPWHQDAVVFGKSGLPWSALAGQPRPRYFELPNAHQANRQIVRVDVYESLGDWRGEGFGDCRQETRSVLQSIHTANCDNGCRPSRSPHWLRVVSLRPERR